MSPAIGLLAFGVLFELAGIILVASPDLFPFARRLSRWLRPHFENIRNRLARLFRRPRDVTVSVPPAGARARGVFPLSVSTAMSRDASLEAKVEYLLDRDQEAQEREKDQEARLSAIESETPERLEELRQGMELHVAEALAAAHREYREVRIFGVVLLALGLAFVTAANFL